MTTHHQILLRRHQKFSFGRILRLFFTWSAGSLFYLLTLLSPFKRRSNVVVFGLVDLIHKRKTCLAPIRTRERASMDWEHRTPHARGRSVEVYVTRCFNGLIKLSNFSWREKDRTERQKDKTKKKVPEKTIEAGFQ